MKQRRYDLDWLRVVATLAVFVFHCTRFFDTEGWHLKNAQQSDLLFVLMRALLWPWLMEIFFLLSGAGAWYALKSRTARAFLVDRVKRLLVPLYTVGLFLLCPPQFYFEVLTNYGYSGTFWQSVRLYCRQLRLPGIAVWPSRLLPVAFAGHLWFLQFLFLISLLTLPLLLYLKSPRGQGWIERLAGWGSRPGRLLWFVLPLVGALIALRAPLGSGRTWADWIYYALYFVAGYVLVADERFTASIVKHRRLCALLWLLAVSAQAVIVLGLQYDLAQSSFSPLYVIYQIVVSVLSWSAVVVVLGLGASYLNRNHPRLAEANEAVLPFYVFHQTIILLVGWFVIRLPLGILPKLLIVMAISFPLILGLCRLLVRPFDLMRFLFGMRPKKQGSPAWSNHPNSIPVTDLPPSPSPGPTGPVPAPPPGQQTTATGRV